MNRIETIFSLIKQTDKVVDVGCDSAKLSILLAKRKQKSIASDISENVIKKTKTEIDKLKLNDYIDLRLSNGLENISQTEIDTLVLSGLGTFTIIKILNNTNIKLNKIITISNNNHDILRTTLNELGYIIHKEQIIKEKNKYYNLIIFIPGKETYSQKEVFIGKNHIDKKLYIEYLNILLAKNKKIKKSSKNKNNKIDKYIEIINKELKEIK